MRDARPAELVSQVHCPGSQNDITVNDGILVTSTDSRRTDDSCDSTRRPPGATTWEGLKIFDIPNPRNPGTSVGRTDCGSHTHTVLPERDRADDLRQSYDIGAAAPTASGPHDKISIV